MPAVIQGVLVCGRRGWGWPGRSRTGIGCSSPLAPVGAGLCPSPASRVDGGFKRICRGRPVCRPVNGSRAEVCPGGHIGPPLRDAGNVPEITEIGTENEHSPCGGTRGRHAGVVVPYGWLRRAAAIALASGAQRSVCAAVARDGWGLEQRSPPKGVINLGQSLSHGFAVPAPFTQGSLWGRGRIAASLRSSQ